MRATSTIARGTRHIVGVGLQALLLAAIVATVALAMSAFYKPAGFVAGVDKVDAGRSTVSIALVETNRVAGSWPTAGSAVTFSVSPGSIKERDLPKLWVANKCVQDSAVVYAEYQPVLDGLAGPFGLTFDGAASCQAYVWMFPSSETPLRGGSMDYVAE